MKDLHNCGQTVVKTYDNIQNSEKISKENKEDISEFLTFMEDQELSDSRKMRYLTSAKIVMENNDFRLKTASKEQIRAIHRQIVTSVYYHKDYSPETKKEYKKLLRIYYKWDNGGLEVPEKASFITLTVKENVKQRTRPQDLPKPDDIKLICQELGNLRDQALFLTHWDLGSRIGETLNIKVRDYFDENGRKTIRVPGNKDSPDRDARVKIAAPAIDRWLKEEHPAPEDPEAYLFCLKEPQGKVKADEIRYHPASYNYLARTLREIKKDTGLECKVNSHTIRKARISFLKALGMPETSVDKRVGHIVGSETTREYTRLSDSDSNNAYDKGYGDETSENDLDEDLLPLTCQECEIVNPGFQDRCYKCRGMLEIRELQGLFPPAERARKLVMEVLDEKNLMEAIEQKI